MEFKGTKGDWYTMQSINQMVVDDTTIASLNGNFIFTTAEKHGDSTADALLICCAPKMLEMLIKLYAEDLLKDNADDVLKLIKEATELK